MGFQVIVNGTTFVCDRVDLHHGHVVLYWTMAAGDPHMRNIHTTGPVRVHRLYEGYRGVL